MTPSGEANSVTAIAIKGSNVFAGTLQGIFLSTNNGAGWKMLDAGGWFQIGVQSLALSGNNLFIGSNNAGMYRSTDNGTNWIAVNSGLPSNATIYSLAVSINEAGDTTIYAGTQFSGVFLSTNNGTTWNAINNGLPSDPIYALAVSGTYLFAGTWNYGAFRSTNNGASWSSVNNGLTSLNVKTLAVNGSNVFAGTIGLGGVFLSTNYGQSWTVVNSGLPSSVNVQTLVTNDTYLFVGLATPGSLSKSQNEACTLSGIANSGVWRRRLSEMNTAVKDGVKNVPLIFALQQNYPNPFNPATTISFTLPSRSYVLLKVFDLIGREITTIFSEEMSAGTYSKRWNADNMSSGIYFYRLQTGTFTETKKLILLK
jgi:hypothetical protein